MSSSVTLCQLNRSEWTAIPHGTKERSPQFSTMRGKSFPLVSFGLCEQCEISRASHHLRKGITTILKLPPLVSDIDENRPTPLFVKLPKSRVALPITAEMRCCYSVTNTLRVSCHAKQKPFTNSNAPTQTVNARIFPSLR